MKPTSSENSTAIPSILNSKVTSRPTSRKASIPTPLSQEGRSQVAMGYEAFAKLFPTTTKKSSSQKPEFKISFVESNPTSKDLNKTPRLDDRSKSSDKNSNVDQKSILQSGSLRRSIGSLTPNMFTQVFNSARTPRKSAKDKNNKSDHVNTLGNETTARIGTLLPNRASSAKQIPAAMISPRLEEITSFKHKFAALDDYDKPVGIIQDEAAKFSRTMKFLNSLEAVKKGNVSVTDRVNFMKSPSFNKFLVILKDRQLPKPDDENFYLELEAQLKQEVTKRNRQLKVTIEDQSKKRNQKFH